MKGDIDYKIGSNVKFYRNSINMSLTELAKKIDKSKSTVSKYEKGTVSIDIETLYKIADILDIDVLNLIDYSDKIKKDDFEHSNEFEKCEKLYIYNYYEKKYHCSVMTLRHNNNSEKIYSTFYYKVTDIENLSKCDCIYRGYMKSYKHTINFVLQNYHSKSEEILLNFFVPLNDVSTINGMLIGLQAKTLKPVCFKIILSKNHLCYDDVEYLLKTTKYDIISFKENKGLMFE